MTSIPKITVNTTINASMANVWNFYTNPENIVKWNNASDDWHTPWATNDLRVGGKFVSRMEAKDKSFGFDFNGVYTTVKTHQLIEYTIEGGRKVSVVFASKDGKTDVTTVFEAENENPLDMQKAGWQSILNNFKKYVESQK